MWSSLRRQRWQVRIWLNYFGLICRHGRAPLQGRVYGGSCRGSCLIELGCHVGDGKIQGSDTVGQSGADREFTAVDRGVGPAYHRSVQLTVHSDECAELAIELIDVSLDRGPGPLREALMGIAIDLALPREHEGPGQAGFRVGVGFVDMNRDDTNRSDLARAGHVKALRCARDRISGGQRILVGDGPQRLGGRASDRTYLLDQVKQAADLATG